ncbi:MAG TPA: hypothetical protein VG737_11060 [Cyclobacteriaceae bacterium]|nr:hypothetical protein [Cyclobacteriaceae bacterium]
MPAIIFGFDDEISGTIAYHALKEWAKDDELIVALLNKKDHIDATLIHTTSYETATISQLAFNEDDYLHFVSNEPQDRRLVINHRINPIKSSSRIITLLDPSPLMLARYILVIADNTRG